MLKNNITMTPDAYIALATSLTEQFKQLLRVDGRNLSLVPESHNGETTDYVIEAWDNVVEVSTRLLAFGDKLIENYDFSSHQCIRLEVPFHVAHGLFAAAHQALGIYVDDLKMKKEEGKYWRKETQAVLAQK